MNGAPTGYAANQPTPNNSQPPRKRTGATRDARMTDAKPRTGQYKTTNRPQHATSADAQRGRPIVPFGTGRHKWRPYGLRREPTDAMPQNGRNTPHLPTPNAADRLCRSGTGRHKWRPYGLRREPADAKQQSTARKRRGATCDARKTAGVTPRPDAGDDRQGASRRTPV